MQSLGRMSVRHKAVTFNSVGESAKVEGIVHFRFEMKLVRMLLRKSLPSEVTGSEGVVTTGFLSGFSTQRRDKQARWKKIRR